LTLAKFKDETIETLASHLPNTANLSVSFPFQLNVAFLF
jgi:hypothetical protein